MHNLSRDKLTVDGGYVFSRRYIAKLGLMMSAFAPLGMSSVPYVHDKPPHVTYQIVTNEIQTKLPTGKTMEVYRFDPGVFVVEQGTNVELKLIGVKGHDHPVTLEGYNVSGTIKKNTATSLKFTADKPGVFRLICVAHADVEHQGPMEGYLVVVPK